ncbi:MAG TPA: bifunctional oligoribonuclease/PAP phosphatase NrnA [Actinomycetota bacterium]|nr:bifunctional oligoribonuclease/PAP phosphatase NrnA [Actinomycetota bacterium]
MERDWKGAVDALQGANRVAVACHVNPDGDALGSLFASAIALKRLGKEVWPSWGTPGAEVPSGYRFLPGNDLFVAPEEVPDCDVFLALDCGGSDRLGGLEEKASKAPVLINIDHHPGNSDFGTYNIVATQASSTAELVGRLLLDLGIEIDVAIATCLYTGIVTDTGRFSYSNSSPDTLRMAADLLTSGVDAPAIALEVFESAPFGYLKLVGRVLDRAVLHGAERFVYSWLTQQDLIETGVTMPDTEKVIDLVRGTRDADVAALYKQQEDGAWRVSLRSKGPVSVGSLARERGGGGHELAAGFTAAELESSVEDLLHALRS